MMRLQRAAAVALVAVLAAALAVSSRAQQCGSQAGGALCPDCLCCSEWGYCGSTDDYCGNGCQSQCDGCGGGGGGGGGGDGPAEGTISSILTEELFETLLKNRNGNGCTNHGFFTYNALITAANSFPDFGTTGSLEVQKREIAAFLGQTGHETTGGSPNADDGAYTWGLCFKVERACESGTAGPACDYCEMLGLHAQWPCVPGKQYYGRGPIQLSYNYNYGPAGEHPAIAQDLLNNPDLVAQDAVVSFKTAIWFWMTPRGNKPSCHDVITEQWTPSQADVYAGRLPGYGVTTNIINGGIECGKGYNEQAANRTFFYTSYCEIFGISPGDNLDCYNQRSFDSGVFLPAGATTTATLEDRAEA
ncbi:unnamed protein product [Urochloa humidicola]